MTTPSNKVDVSGAITPVDKSGTVEGSLNDQNIGVDNGPKATSESKLKDTTPEASAVDEGSPRMEKEGIATSLRGSPPKRKNPKVIRKQPQVPKKKKPKSDDGSNDGSESSSASSDMGSDEEYKGPKLPPSPEKRPTRMVVNRQAARSQLTQQSLDQHFDKKKDEEEVVRDPVVPSPEESDDEKEIMVDSRSRNSEFRSKCVDVTNLNAFISDFQTKGYGLAALSSLGKEVFPSWKIVMLGKMSRNRGRRRSTHLPGHGPEVSNSLQVVMFKKPRTTQLPGLSADTIADYFSRLFVSTEVETRESTSETLKQLVNNNLSMILLVTSQEISGLHTILAGVIFNADDRQGIFVPYIGVLDSDLGDCLKIDENTFTIPDEYETSQGTHTWRGMDVCKYLFSMVQLVSSLMWRQKNSTPQFPGQLTLQLVKANIYKIYLQVRLENRSHTYSIYVTYGFQPANANRRDFLCWNYKREIGVGNFAKTDKINGWIGLLHR